MWMACASVFNLNVFALVAYCALSVGERGIGGNLEDDGISFELRCKILHCSVVNILKNRSEAHLILSRFLNIFYCKKGISVSKRWLIVDKGQL